MEDPPHMTAFSAEDPFHLQSPGFGIDLGIESLGELHGMEETEVSALRGIGAQGIIETDFVEKDQVAQKGVPVGAAKVIGRGGDEEDLRPFPVEGGLDRIPVISSISSAANSMVDLMAWGGMPRWFPVRLQFEAGSRIQLILQPTRLRSSLASIVISAVSIP